jgi:glycine/D-amino acid oxidase-like deaminating enzyme
MEIEYLLIGQGISGTWLSYYLQKEGKSFLVIDAENKNAPSRIAAGIINPVTGRRHVTTWMAEEVLPFAWQAYQQMGHEMGIEFIVHRNLLDFFPSPQMRVNFLQRVEEKSLYVHTYPEQNQFNHLLHYDFGCGEIRPVYTVYLELVLPAWRKQLYGLNKLREEDFSIEELKVEKDHVQYRDITAGKIIFCDGHSSTANPYFNLLPFAPNKGEALLLEIPDLPDQHIYKRGMTLSPLSTPGSWWIGSSYEWEFDHPDPTTIFREKTERFLKEWLKIPFRVTHHLAGIRPATLERRPFVGSHPLHSSLGIFNGMGTKGCSLAPFLAKQFVDHLVYNLPLHPEADVNRFRNILSKTNF